MPDAIYYYDPSAAPDFSVFERILFPVLFNTAGAHGSQWVSEAAIANPAHWYIETYNDVVPFECIDYPCGERLAPGSSIAFSGGGYPQGVALIAPRAEAENLAFSLRVRDISRTAEGYGTQVPVVREDDMFVNTDLTLLDVPVDPRYRTKCACTPSTRASPSGGRHAHGNRADVVSEPTTFPAPHAVPARVRGAPWYAELDLPPGETDERVNVYVGSRHRARRHGHSRRSRTTRRSRSRS